MNLYNDRNVFMYLLLHCVDHGEEEDEGKMIEWFTLVNDKNELVRTEADLIYM